MITSLHTVQWFIHNLKTNKKGWGCTTKAEGHFIIAKLLNRLRCDSSSEILSPRVVWLVNWGVKSLGVTLPLPSLTNSQPATDRTDFPSLSLRAVVLIWLRWECVVVWIENRENFLLTVTHCCSEWLTRVLTTTLSRHGDADCRPLAPVLAAAGNVAKSAVSPLPCETRLG